MVHGGCLVVRHLLGLENWLVAEVAAPTVTLGELSDGVLLLSCCCSALAVFLASLHRSLVLAATRIAELWALSAPPIALFTDAEERVAGTAMDCLAVPLTTGA